MASLISYAMLYLMVAVWIGMPAGMLATGAKILVRPGRYEERINGAWRIVGAVIFTACLFNPLSQAVFHAAIYGM